MTNRRGKTAGYGPEGRDLTAHTSTHEMVTAIRAMYTKVDARRCGGDSATINRKAESTRWVKGVCRNCGGDFFCAGSLPANPDKHVCRVCRDRGRKECAAALARLDARKKKMKLRW